MLKNSSINNYDIEQHIVKPSHDQSSNGLTSSIKISPLTQFSLSEWETDPVNLIYLRAHSLYCWAEINGDEDDYEEALILISSTIEGQPNQLAFKKLKNKLFSQTLPTQI